jgi:hypothetical protein
MSHVQRDSVTYTRVTSIKMVLLILGTEKCDRTD